MYVRTTWPVVVYQSIRMKSIIIVCLGVIISCDGYEYLYDQDDSDLRWLYDNQLYGHGYRNFEFNGDFDDYV